MTLNGYSIVFERKAMLVDSLDCLVANTLSRHNNNIWIYQAMPLHLKALKTSNDCRNPIVTNRRWTAQLKLNYQG